MDDGTSFSDQILEAVSAALSAVMDGSVIVTGFVLAAEFISGEGDVELTVTHPSEQSTARTLGLVGFADEWIRDDMRVSFRNLAGFDE